MKKGIANITILFLFLATGLQSQNYLHCLSANVNSDILLQWDPPVNAPSFVSYTVYHSNNSSGNVYSPLTTISNFSTTTYLHTGANASSESQFYYIETSLSSGGSIISDTLKSIFLTINTGVGNVELNWTVPRNPPLSSWESQYQVWMEYPQNNWTQIGTSSITNFFYEIQVCDDSLTFRIDLNDNFGCKLMSNYKGGAYQDITKPPMPVMDTVSIDQALGKSIIGWNINPAEDTEGYIIYKYINTSWIIIDTVLGRFNTLYTDMSSSPCSVVESYALAAFDSCGNKSLGTFLTPQQTISLNNITYNTCDPSHTLNWSEYINMDPGILGYEIFVSTNSSTYQAIAQTSPAIKTFTNYNIQYGNDYSYFVRAYNQGNQNTSSSCFRDNFTRQYSIPQFNYVSNATVIDDSYIQITSYIDAGNSISKAILRRFNETTASYIRIDSVENINQDLISFDDNSADVHSGSYTYDILLKDSCDYDNISTNSLNSIFLQASIIDANSVRLSWNEIFGWNGLIEEYKIYRKINEQGSPDFVAAVNPTENEYIDDISSLNLGGETFSYYIEAIEGNSNIYGFKESSISNEARVEENAKIFFPNAFRPGGVNNIFKPTGIFVNQKDYLMQIYNRWGELIFETRSFQDGWDGRKNGNNAATGVYLYIVSYTNTKGEGFQHKGTFVLVR